MQKNKWRSVRRINKSFSLGCSLSYLFTVFCFLSCQVAACWSDVTKSAAGVFIVSTKYCFWNMTSSNPGWILSYCNSRGSAVLQSHYEPGDTFNRCHCCDFFGGLLGQIFDGSNHTNRRDWHSDYILKS